MRTRPCSSITALPCNGCGVLDEAHAFVRSMPVGKEGLAFLDGGAPVQPDPDNLKAYGEHAG